MNDLISRLSEIRSRYNCFNEAERPYYDTLTEVIKNISQHTDGDMISRQAAILQLSHNKCGNDENDIAVQHDIETIRALSTEHPKMSRWVRHDTGHSTYYDCYRCNCSAPCTETADSMLWKLSDYCPDCGAKMLNALPHCIAEDLPSAQPQQVTGKLNSDCISRQEAIKELEELNAISFYELNEHSREAYREIKQMLKELPPAQTKTEERTEKSAQYVPNDDLISRKAAIDAVCAVCGNDCDKSEFVYNAPQDEQVIICPEHFVLCTLPSAQPEQTDCEYCHEDFEGYVKPIEKNNHAFVRFGMDGWELYLKANGWHGSAKIRYCPMCGRRLTGWTI